MNQTHLIVESSIVFQAGGPRFIECSQDATALIALDLVVEAKGIVRWFDTQRERRISCASQPEIEAGCIRFLRSGTQWVYTSAPLTLALYRERVMPRLPAKPKFDSEADLYIALYQSRALVA